MNWNLLLKYLGYAFILTVYGVFAWSGKADVAGYLAVLTGVLGVLGGVHASTAAIGAATKQATPPAVTPAPASPITPQP